MIDVVRKGNGSMRWSWNNFCILLTFFHYGNTLPFRESLDYICTSSGELMPLVGNPFSEPEFHEEDGWPIFV